MNLCNKNCLVSINTARNRTKWIYVTAGATACILPNWWRTKQVAEKTQNITQENKKITNAAWRCDGTWGLPYISEREKNLKGQQNKTCN